MTILSISCNKDAILLFISRNKGEWVKEIAKKAEEFLDEAVAKSRGMSVIKGYPRSHLATIALQGFI